MVFFKDCTHDCVRQKNIRRESSRVYWPLVIQIKEIVKKRSYIDMSVTETSEHLKGKVVSDEDVQLQTWRYCEVN